MPATKLMEAGIDIGKNIVNTGMGLLLEGHNDRRQLKQQGKLNEQQYDINNRMAESNYERQMRLWNDTNYKAQMDQLRIAGLNPGLIYEGSGAGGTTQAAQAQGVGGAQAPAGGMEIMNMMMNKAQIDLIKAQTEKTKAETGNVPLTGKNIEASTANLKADTANKAVQKEILETESYLKNIESYIAEETQNDAVAMVRTGLRKFTAEMHTAETQQRITQETADNNIKIVAADYAGILLQNKAIQKSMNKTNEEIKAIIQSVKESINRIDMAKGQLAIDQQIADFNTSFGTQVGGVIGSLLNLIPGLKKKPGTTVNNTRETHIHTKNK